MKHSILDQLPRYDRYMGGKGGLDIGYPWLSIGAIVALEQYILRPELHRRETPEQMASRLPKRYLEFGSGGSTVFFARRVEYVRSFETDPKWEPMTRQYLEEHGLTDKVELTLQPLTEAMSLVAALPNDSFDIMLVDHADPLLPRGKIVDRLPLAMVGLPKLKMTGWLVVDNYAMHGMQNFDYAGWAVWHFDDMRYSGRGTLIARRKA